MKRRALSDDGGWLAATRAVVKLAAFAALTLPLMPVQALFLWTSRDCTRAFPHWYHRQVCRILGIRLHIEGDMARDRGVLLVSNHTSWLDITVLSAVAPVSFVAKKEVGTWPFVSWLAWLQRSIFIDRTRRAAVAGTAREILDRLAAGDAIVLFAEGTSSDGNRVLPFQTSLFAVAKPNRGGVSDSGDRVAVQTLAIVYSHLSGLPLGRAERPKVGWYGDMEMGGHAWELLRAGPIDVRIRIGAPLPLESFENRKSLARHTEAEVREAVVRLLRDHSGSEPLAIAAKPARRLAAPAA